MPGRRPTATRPSPLHNRPQQDRIPEATLELDDLPELGGVELDSALTLEPIKRIGRDLIQSAHAMSSGQARYAVDMYYQIQTFRLRASNQARAAESQQEPNDFITWLLSLQGTGERTIRLALDKYTDKQPVGAWAKSIVGIGPVICAGMLANLDEIPPPTVGHWWRFAGLDPTLEWLGAEKARQLISEIVGKEKTITIEHVTEIAMRSNRRPERLILLSQDPDSGNLTRSHLTAALSRRPWNAHLKVLCWKAGESFVKVHANPRDVYGKIYVARKQYEQERNVRGQYKDQADLWATRVSQDTIAYQSYSKGMLPDGHIHSRAKRYAVKLFLSHYHTIAYWVHFGILPPRPYAIDRLGHAHVLLPPNADQFDGLLPALQQWAAGRTDTNHRPGLPPA